MQIKSNHIVIPGITALVLFIGKLYTEQGMDWYHTIAKPSLTPPDWAFPLMWFVIFLGVTNVGLIVWNRFVRDGMFYGAVTLFFINGLLNILWTKLFFYNHNLLYALIDAIVLEISIVFLVMYVLPRSRLAAFSLLPYALWVLFAIYLNYQIFMMN
jgi:tryptophan-rich sensory protein